jgi:hypothetical protein
LLSTTGLFIALIRNQKQIHQNPEKELFLLQGKFDGLPAFSLSALPAVDFNAERTGESDTALHFFES